MHLILGGGGMAACLAAYLCWIKLASDAHSLRTAHTLGQMMFMLSMFILLPSLVCSVGLLFEKSWGRVVAIGWSMLLLLVIPIGTLLGFYGLWVLLKQTPSSAYPKGSEHSSRPHHAHDFEPRKTFSLVDWIAGQRPPAELDNPFRIAVILLFGISSRSSLLPCAAASSTRQKRRRLPRRTANSPPPCSPATRYAVTRSPLN